MQNEYDLYGHMQYCKEQKFIARQLELKPKYSVDIIKHKKEIVQKSENKIREPFIRNRPKFLPKPIREFLEKRGLRMPKIKPKYIDGYDYLNELIEIECDFENARKNIDAAADPSKYSFFWDALTKCETIVKSELNSFYRVAKALAIINEHHLYYPEQSDYFSYVDAVWLQRDEKSFDLIQQALYTDKNGVYFGNAEIPNTKSPLLLLAGLSDEDLVNVFLFATSYLHDNADRLCFKPSTGFKKLLRYWKRIRHDSSSFWRFHAMPKKQKPKVSRGQKKVELLSKTVSRLEKLSKAVSPNNMNYSYERIDGLKERVLKISDNLNLANINYMQKKKMKPNVIMKEMPSE